MTQTLNSSYTNKTILYVSPTGGGSGLTSDSPMHFRTALATYRRNVSFQFLPGTYDFEDDPWYILRDCTILAADANNRPVFTRSSFMSDPQTSYIFACYGDCVIGNVIFDKWDAGNGNADTDVPSCAYVPDTCQGSALKLYGKIDVNATKFDNAAQHVYCFFANRGCHLILTFPSTSGGKFTFNSLASTSSDAGSGTFSLFVARTASVLRFSTDDSHEIEVKAGALGKNLQVFENMRGQNHGIVNIVLDSCYRIVKASAADSLQFTFKQQGYNPDGTVDDKANGGVDYKVHKAFVLDHCYGYLNVTLLSDVYCERGFVYARNGNVKLNVMADNIHAVASTPDGNSLSDNVAIWYDRCNGSVKLNDNVNINVIPFVQFAVGFKATDTCCAYLTGETTQPVHGRDAAAQFSNVARGVVSHIKLKDATDGLLVEATGSRVYVADTSIEDNDTGIHVRASSDVVVSSNVTFSGNTSNYGTASVSTADAHVYNVPVGA